jgi:hypothetical protein
VEFSHAGVFIGDTAMDDTQLSEFITGYIKAATFYSDDNDGDPLTANFSPDFSPDDLPLETTLALTLDCIHFTTDMGATLHDAFIRVDGYNHEKAGIDFWLTRNGHGSGFWDRKLGNIGEELTSYAHTYGERHLYVGDDGKVYAA